MQAQSINTIYLEPIPSVFTVEVKQWEIDYVVREASKGESYYFVSMVVESAPINEAIRRGLVVCDENGLLSLPPAAPAEEPNADEPTEQCAITSIDQLETTITNCKASQDKSLQVHGSILEQCLGTDPWTRIIEEAEREMATTNQIEPIIYDPDLKLRQATEHKQVFTGSYLAVKRNAEVLAIGGSLIVRMRRHGKNGTWLLIVEESEYSPHSQAA